MEHAESELWQRLQKLHRELEGEQMKKEESIKVKKNTRAGNRKKTAAEHKSNEKMPKSGLTRAELTLEVIERLKREYPDATCTLDYNDAWKLLVGVRLAAQCTDERVNIVVKDLYAKYPDVDALAAAEPEDIEAIVRPCGLGKSKARDISACMRILRDQYDGQIPETFDELLKLPGRCV